MRPLLTISMLVCGRTDTMWKSIESLRPIREAIPTELILIDTGCNEETHKKIEELADKVIDFTWCKDFSAARNVGIEAASGEWFMFLDDDEWFSNSQPIIDFFLKGEYKEVCSASYIQRNYLDMDGSQYSDFDAWRMAKITPELHFVNKIHEQLTGVSGSGVFLDAVVEHYGYVYTSEEEKMAHFHRNESLLLEMIQEAPSDLRLGAQYLQELRSIDDYDKLIHWGQIYEKIVGFSDKVDSSRLGTFLAAQMLGYHGKNQFIEAMELADRMIQSETMTDMAKLFACQLGCRCAYFTENYEKALVYGFDYFRGLALFEENVTKMKLEKATPFVGECTDLVKQKETYSILICCGLKQGDSTNLIQYFQYIGWNEGNIYIFEDMARTLITAFNDLEFEGAFYQVIDSVCQKEALRDYFLNQMAELEEEGMNLSQIRDIFAKAKQAEEIKAQLTELIYNGLISQAKQVLAQVYAILPFDPDLNPEGDWCENVQFKLKKELQTELDSLKEQKNYEEALAYARQIVKIDASDLEAAKEVLILDIEIEKEGV